MKPGFTQATLHVNFHLSGNLMDLLEYLYFNSEVFGQLRTKTKTDGISDPAALQMWLQKFGEYVASGILHDGGYHDKLEQLRADGSWAVITLTETQCNKLIDEALKTQGCSWLKRELIYDALQLFGWSAFDADRHAAAGGQEITSINLPAGNIAPDYA